ncbi:MAG: D-alanine--D-alanine ligase [Candidatus Omnitrophica bacterium]|nr:D-alanine--D-alanine ligase [Candidatus Omnitrophota bacterium]
MKHNFSPDEFGKIGVLMGGISSERDISLKSGKAVYNALNSGKLDVVAIDLTTEDEPEVRSILKKSGISIAFIALHGKFGEDGTIQGILGGLSIPYTGSGVSASRLAMDKIASRRIFQEKNIPVPDYEILQMKEKNNLNYKKLKFNSPVLVIKPATQGSSVGVSFVEKETDLPKAIDLAFTYDDRIIIEEYLPGREITVGILEEKPLPIVEIIPKKRFFDFQAKYEKGMTDYAVPAKLPPKIYKNSQEIGLRAHKAIGCSTFSRVDMILKNDTPYVLEVNSIPGLTATSLLPKAALAINIDFLDLCLRIIKNAYGEEKT